MVERVRTIDFASADARCTIFASPLSIYYTVEKKSSGATPDFLYTIKNITTPVQPWISSVIQAKSIQFAHSHC